MSSAIDVANYVKPEIVPVYKYTAEIDITPKGPARTWAPLCAGFNNISEAMNETIQQYFFLCGSGHAVNYVTGMAPSMTMAGVRVIGDAAQDFMFNSKYTLMSSRDTHFRITRTAENGTKHVISANVTFCNMSDISGGTTDGSAISVEMRFNGSPFIGDAWANAPTAYVVSQALLNVSSSFVGDSVISGAPFTATLTADSGYVIASVVVTMGDSDVTATAYDPLTGVVTIADVTGNITITANGSVTTYTVTQTLSNVTTDITATIVNYGASISGTVTADAGYSIDSVNVTMGGVDITSSAYDSTDDSITIASVTGNVVITASAS
jgi:hypothetical protein